MESQENLDLGISIITGTWDDLPALISRLGYAFTNLGESLAVCKDPKTLQDCKALYVACGAECGMSDVAAHNIRQFVARGGGLYCSDLAAALIERVFPALINFSRLDYRSDNTVRVLDPALALQLGASISLHMDYTSAVGIQAAASGVQVLIHGTSNDFDEHEYPYLVTFNHGQGQVLYTVFHNAHQVDETEARLLRYLILRPLLTSALAQAHQALAPLAGTPLMEIISTASSDQTAERYAIRVDHPGTIRLALVWQGRASFGVGITGPNGKRLTYQSTDNCPLRFDLSVKKSGEYAFYVKGINIPQPNFPYVLLIEKP